MQLFSCSLVIVPTIKYREKIAKAAKLAEIENNNNNVNWWSNARNSSRNRRKLEIDNFYLGTK